MIAKTVYIADDGRNFDNEWDCLEYEARRNDSVRMYGTNGKTSRVAYTMAVKLSGDGARYFQELSGKENCGFEGIHPNEEGVFVWIDHMNQYVFLDDDVYAALKRMVKDDEKEEI